MGERKGTNKYYPPDFDPAKHGSLNGYHKTHALRERARKLSQGILIIRFEMPYNIWCDGCKNHIGMGVRYNAEKKKVGNYYSTAIYRFRMKCHLCVNYIEMQTDPATCDYVIVSGAQRKEERWDMAENEQILTTERMEKEKLETDAMFKLDHGGKDKEKLTNALPSLTMIQEYQSRWKDDFQLNSALRSKFRTEKKVRAKQESEDNAVRMRTNLSIPLLPEKSEDRKLAALLTFQAPESFKDKQDNKRKEVSSRSWFSSTSPTPGSAAGKLLHKISLQGKEAAVAKNLGSSLRPLIRKHSALKIETGANSVNGRVPPENTCNGGISEVSPQEEEPSTSSAHLGQEPGKRRTTAPEGLGDGRAEATQDSRSSGFASLVADYSDSDSDSAQEG
ncbi:putative splicing factor YJU2B [Nelusetta ayraudi]|uniref:putative splicing factor YJU2B n=1 Tax=Nelusetta ayraudi TaxID=303726 RepID=UPI003F6FEF07